MSGVTQYLIPRVLASTLAVHAAKIRKSCFSDTSGSNIFHELDLYLDLWIDRTDTHALRPSPTVNSATDDPAHTFKLARSYHSPAAFGFARWTPPALGTQQAPLEHFSSAVFQLRPGTDHIFTLNWLVPGGLLSLATVCLVRRLVG